MAAKAKTANGEKVVGKFLTSVNEFQGERREAGDDLTQAMLSNITPNAREALLGEGIFEIFGQATGGGHAGASAAEIKELNAKVDFLTDLVEGLVERVAAALPKVAKGKAPMKKTKSRAEGRATH